MCVFDVHDVFDKYLMSVNECEYLHKQYYTNAHTDK